jgi:hypothetical protein
MSDPLLPSGIALFANGNPSQLAEVPAGYTGLAFDEAGNPLVRRGAVNERLLGCSEITPDTDTTITGPIIGDAVTGKARGPLDSDFLVGPPLVIAEGETYRVPANQQVGFRFDMQVDGDLVVDGTLYAIADTSKFVSFSDLAASTITPSDPRLSDARTPLPHTHTIVDVSDLSSALLAKLDATDPSVTNAREWTAETVSKAAAETGTETIRRAWTAERVRQAAISLLLEWGIAQLPSQFDTTDWSV